MPIAALFFVAASSGIAIHGCYLGGEYGDFSCPFPNKTWTDDYGQRDPCCNRKACCPNPLWDHTAHDPAWEPGYGEPLWDPCCMTEPCPGHNVYLPPDAGIPSENSDASTDHASCDGQCFPKPPEGWWGPALLWTGAPGQEPECPSYVSHKAYSGHADLMPDPLSCAQCACDPPAGKCILPTTFTAHSATCLGDVSGVVHTDFSAPPSWDGACTSVNAIPAGAQCKGGPCVRSLSIQPLTIEESDCVAHAVQPKAVPGSASLVPPWMTSAVACQLNCSRSCEDGQKVCAPEVSAKPDGFTMCIFADGEQESCPEAYPVKQVFYQGYSDTRACSACTCDSPVGGECSANVSIFQQADCKGPTIVGGLPISTAEAPYCVDFSAGLGLGSKAISTPVYKPSACTPHGGVLAGTVSEVGPATFCCLQS